MSIKTLIEWHFVFFDNFLLTMEQIIFFKALLDLKIIFYLIFGYFEAILVFKRPFNAEKGHKLIINYDMDLVQCNFHRE